ncbi:MAG: hypothetical protein OEW58_06830 [Gammaproteobacteria bacterium]|nr:hypothetical protein [Gammaproteobacteria bacterium]
MAIRLRTSMLVLLLWHGSPTWADQPPAAPNTVSAVIPITMANLRGQKALYKEGWFIVSSTENTLRYAREKSLRSSGQALQQMRAHLARHSGELGTNLVDDVTAAGRSGRTILSTGTEFSGDILQGTHQLAKWQLEAAQSGFVSAWDSFVLGNLSLVARTEDDRQALRAIPGDFFTNVKADFSNVYELTDRTVAAVTPTVEVKWSDAMSEAAKAFDDEYQASGEAGNSLAGLGNIVSGYAKALYFGVAKPGSKAVVKGATATASLGGKLIFLPTAGVLIVSGRTVQSAGMTLYYTTSAGVKLVSPTVEGGLLAGVSLLAATTVPVTYAAGASAGLVNQVAVTTMAPVAATAQAAGTVALDTAAYAGQVSYDLIKGGGTVVFNQASSGVALGYNALTALPVQALLGTANATFFLVYDGPRLLVAKVSGELDGAHPLSELPVGSVVDMTRLQQQPGVTLEVISDDPAVVEQVLQRLPEDLRP